MSTPTSPIGQLSGPVVLTGVVPGYAIIPSPTPLTFLNYYDGKFLQASDLRREQLATQSMIELSNQAGGTPGPSYGFDITLGCGDTLTLGPGLATDQQGRVLYLPQSVDVAVSDLLASMQVQGGSGSASPPCSGTAGSAATGVAPTTFQPCDPTISAPSATPVSGTDLYLVTLAAAEGLCGTNEVFGQLCEAACVTASDRPWRIEGVLLGLVPLTLGQVPTSKSVMLTQTHLRSRVASAYYAAETAAGASLTSAAGLAAGAWCLGAAPVAGDAIYLGVLARAGGSTVFLDEWTARRERIETCPQRYWAGRMTMRPWNVFLAQVLQYQCQLSEVLSDGGTVNLVTNPLDQAMTLLGRSAELIDELQAAQPAPAQPAPEPAAPTPAAAPAAPVTAGSTLEQDIADYRQEVTDVLAGKTTPSSHALIDGGIVELPPAGWLPVNLTTGIALEMQMYQMLGAGVDLRFCVMRHDQAGSEFTRGQHLDRISLLAGLDDPKHQLQQVDILVPDGIWQTAAGAAPAPPSITPSLDWVLFRRRSDVTCSPLPPLDTVTLYADPAADVRSATDDWNQLSAGKGEDVKWTKVGELQFDAGTASLVTTSATVQGWWSAAGIGQQLIGVAYAPVASASDQVALGRANSLVAALAPPAGSGQPAVTALATSPEKLQPGVTDALFVVASPVVTVEVWSTTLANDKLAEQELSLITGNGTGTVEATWVLAGTAALALDSPPKLLSWTGDPSAVKSGIYAGYTPATLLGERPASRRCWARSAARPSQRCRSRRTPLSPPAPARPAASSQSQSLRSNAMADHDHASDSERPSGNDAPRRATAPAKEAGTTSTGAGTAPARAVTPDATRSPDAASLGAQQVKAKLVSEGALNFLSTKTTGQTCSADDQVCEPVQRCGIGSSCGCAPEDQMAGVQRDVQRAITGGGVPLHPGVLPRMGAAFSADFSSVRVHTGPAADEVASKLKAHALTAGPDIVFRDGAYRPGTQSGDRLLAHELAHVVQQRDGLVRAPVDGGPSDPLERAADAAAGHALRAVPSTPAPAEAGVGQAHGAGGSAGTAGNSPAQRGRDDRAQGGEEQQAAGRADEGRKRAPVRGAAASPVTVQRDATDDLADYIARDLDAYVAQHPKPYAHILEVFKKLRPDIEDNVAAAFTELQVDSKLTEFATTKEGRDMLDVLTEAMITGSVTVFESQQAERILIAKANRTPGAEYAAQAERIARLRHRASSPFGHEDKGDEDAYAAQVAQDLHVYAARELYAQIINEFGELRADIQDNVAAAFVELQSDAQLETYAGSSDPKGPGMLDVLYEAIITGSVSAFESLQAERILIAKANLAKANRMPGAEYVAQAERIAGLRDRAEDRASIDKLGVDIVATMIAHGLLASVTEGRYRDIITKINDLSSDIEEQCRLPFRRATAADRPGKVCRQHRWPRNAGCSVRGHHYRQRHRL